MTWAMTTTASFYAQNHPWFSKISEGKTEELLQKVEYFVDSINHRSATLKRH